MAGKVVGVGIAGLGNVGREVARLLAARADAYSAAAGAGLELVSVCDRRAAFEARRLGLPARIRRVRSPADLARDPAVDIVVELFGGLTDARALVLSSLRAGKHVVTGNKLLLSSRWDEVFSTARASGREIYFEAAVAGGIPIIEALRSGLAANRVSSVSGIFNGTTNYILTRMAQTGCELSVALREAQRLGMAEKDPTLDLNGSDTMHKVSILASLLTGRWVPPERVARQGIETIDAEDIRFAVEKLDAAVRLLGTVAVDWDARPVTVEAHVQPTLLPLSHPLASVRGGYNAVLVNASPAGDLMFYGKGAGPGPAASAVVADVIAVARGIAGGKVPAAAPVRAGPALAHSPEGCAPFYLKLRVRDVPGALSRITGILGRRGISIAEIHQSPPAARKTLPGRAVPVMITTHATSRARINAARKDLAHLKTVSPRHTCLRLLP